MRRVYKTFVSYRLPKFRTHPFLGKLKPCPCISEGDFSIYDCIDLNYKEEQRECLHTILGKEDIANIIDPR